MTYGGDSNGNNVCNDDSDSDQTINTVLNCRARHLTCVISTLNRCTTGPLAFLSCYVNVMSRKYVNALLRLYAFTLTITCRWVGMVFNNLVMSVDRQCHSPLYRNGEM